MDGGENGPAVIDYKDISVIFDVVRFVEEDEVPRDAAIVDQTWAKVNKNGTPDRRFKDNYQIPVVAYGQIALMTKTGLNEVYQFSSVSSALILASSLIMMKLAISDKSKFEDLTREVERAGPDVAKLQGVLRRFGA